MLILKNTDSDDVQTSVVKAKGNNPNVLVGILVAITAVAVGALSYWFAGRGADRPGGNVVVESHVPENGYEPPVTGNEPLSRASTSNYSTNPPANTPGTEANAPAANANEPVNNAPANETQPVENEAVDVSGTLDPDEGVQPGSETTTGGGEEGNEGSGGL